MKCKQAPIYFQMNNIFYKEKVKTDEFIMTEMRMQMKIIIIRMIFMLNIHAIKERARKSQNRNSTCPFCRNFAPFEVRVVDV